MISMRAAPLARVQSEPQDAAARRRRQARRAARPRADKESEGVKVEDWRRAGAPNDLARRLRAIRA
jgi:hypothetical protein